MGYQEDGGAGMSVSASFVRVPNALVKGALQVLAGRKVPERELRSSRAPDMGEKRGTGSFGSTAEKWHPESECWSLRRIRSDTHDVIYPVVY